MLIATNYPLLEVFWTILIFFGFVIWLWLLFTVLADIFRRKDASGGVKVAWIVFIIILPFLGVFVYLIAQHKGMAERAIAQQEASKAKFDEYVKSVGGGADPTDQIARAKKLLDEGTISESEFNQIKRSALAS